MERLVCYSCRKEYSSWEQIWRCSCGGVLDLEYKTKFDPERIKLKEPGIWRYRDAIPLKHDSNIVSFSEGFTPLIEVETGNGSVLIKQDHLFPTGSYKDRGASVLISKVKELGLKKVVDDSSGNAGASIAAYCAKANIVCDIYVPEKTSPGKLAQIGNYGANLHIIPGSREKTAEAVLKAAEKDYYASHSWNPWFFQGTKTFAYELCEQMNWMIPDIIVLPAGHGTLFLGAYIGFRDLQETGLIKTIPKMIAVQTANCAPLYSSYLNNLKTPSRVEPMETMAEGIAIAKPVRGSQILEAVRKTNGEIIAVTEDEIRQSLLKMTHSGYYIEPTSAAVIAGAVRYQSENRDRYPKESIVSVFTGHGLKTSVN